MAKGGDAKQNEFANFGLNKDGEVSRFVIDSKAAAVLDNFNTSEDPIGILDLRYQIASGQIPGLRLDNVFGRNEEIDLNVIETVWNVGGVFLPPVAAAVLDFSSTSALDTALGAGAREITFVGLDANYDELIESVATNGTSTASTTGKFLRLNRAFTSGPNGAAGDITISLSGADIGRISPINNRTIHAIYTVAAGKNAYLVAGSASISPADRASGTKSGQTVLSASIAESPSVASLIVSLSTDGSGIVSLNKNWPPFFDEKTDIIASFLGNQNNSSVNVDFQVLLEDKP